MKKIACLILLVFGIISCENKLQESKVSYYIDLKSTNDLEHLFKTEKYPLISSHRGGSAKGFPENSIETFKRATTFGPSIIETDIAMTKDSVLVLMHDDKLDRTTTAKGYVSDYTYAQLQTVYLKDYLNNKTSYKIPTLNQALEWGKGKVIYTLDVKRGVPYEKVIESIRLNNAEAYSLVITYNANQAKVFNKLASDIWLSVSANGKDDIQRLKSYNVNLDNLVAFVGTSQPSASTISYMEQQNIPIILGTLGNLDKSAKANGDVLYYKLFESGITILSADRNKEAAHQALKYCNDKGLQSKFIKKVN